jgi:uncharacterized protein (TIGR02646 family)
VAPVIPVTPRPEPQDFDAKVRRPGKAWLAKKELPAGGKAPAGVELPAFWRSCLADLHREYEGVCAYVCVYLERITGACSVDHFVAKSSAIGAAYEWSNYRLACSVMNSRKNRFDDALDPFELTESPFVLDLVSGRISPSPALGAAAKEKAQATLDRLGLDDAECREMRARHLTSYLAHEVSLAYLERHSPFVWREICRQKAFRKEHATDAPAS